MKEEQNGAPKKKWSRIFRKKWFFPAVYISVAAILLTAVVWYQNVDNQVPDAEENQEASDHYTPDLYDEDAESVMEQSENIKMPVTDQEKAEIVTKFYDASAEQEDKENALVFHNNRYYQSTGIDITLEEDESFDVVASLSGQVEEVKEDPILGNVVTLSHGNDVMTYYASMDDITKEVGDEVKQGDELGTAGNNLFGKDIGPHVHFELRKSGESLNPEEFFNQSVSELDKVEVDEEEGKSDNEEGTDAGDVDEDMDTDPGEGNENDGNASDENDDNADADSDEDANGDSNENNEDADADSNENDAGAGAGLNDNNDEDVDVDMNDENDLNDMDPEE